MRWVFTSTETNVKSAFIFDVIHHVVNGFGLIHYDWKQGANARVE
ncbi:hypothetical protein Mgrana_02467 [Meiothermus granaticius NBRC 107808]|uniref:Uncharacterized protein n=1 Tax=Meiothermus granaticius NBRC 107808 TaxID=1227551 RepID=A0A399F4H8_9DEIN|nr:hypothetical protein Mgrana_02467 [Meiothermus granaticius NBRC 107808]